MQRPFLSINTGNNNHVKKFKPSLPTEQPPFRFSLTIPNANQNSQNSQNSQSSTTSAYPLLYIPSNNESNSENESESIYTTSMKPGATKYDYPSFKAYFDENKEGSPINIQSLFNKLDKIKKTGIAIGGHRLKDNKFIKIYLFITDPNPNFFSLEKFYKELHFQKKASDAINLNSGFTVKNGMTFTVPRIHQYGEVSIDDAVIRAYHTLIGEVGFNTGTLCMSYIIMDLTDGICIRPLSDPSNRNTPSRMHNKYKQSNLQLTKQNTTALATSRANGPKNWGNNQTSHCYLLPLSTVLTITLTAHDLLKNAGVYHNDLGNGNNILYDGTAFVITDFGEATDKPDTSRSFTMYTEHGFGGKRRTRKRAAKRTQHKKSRRHRQ